MPEGVKEKLRESFHSLDAFIAKKPTTLHDAIDGLPNADIFSLRTLHAKLLHYDLWRFVGRLTHVDSIGAMRIIFEPTGDFQAEMESAKPGAPLHDNFCKDTMYGASYHGGAQCYREIVPGQINGLHVVPPNEFHIDAHQPVTGKKVMWDYRPGKTVHLGPVPLILPGGPLFLAKRCAYDIIGDISHMGDVVAGQPINIFTRRYYLDHEIDRIKTRSAWSQVPETERMKAMSELDALKGRLAALDPTLGSLAVKGLEGENASEAARMATDMDAIENEIYAIERRLPRLEQPLRPGWRIRIKDILA